MDDESQSEETGCAACGRFLLPKNQKCHLQFYCPKREGRHRSSSASSVLCRSVHVESRGIEGCPDESADQMFRPTDDDDDSLGDEQYGGLTLEEYARADRAARAMLERRNSYDVASLCSYLEN